MSLSKNNGCGGGGVGHYLNDPHVISKYPYIGSWKIIKCVIHNETPEETKIEGTQFDIEPEEKINIIEKTKPKKHASSSSSARGAASIYHSSSDSYSESSDSDTSTDDDGDDSDNSVNSDDDNNNNANNINNKHKYFDKKYDDIQYTQNADNNNTNNNENNISKYDRRNYSFKSGEILWSLLPENEYMPFFDCTSFQSECKYDLKLSGSKSNSKIKFDIEYSNSNAIMKMKYNHDSEELIEITCERLSNDEEYDQEFSFLNVYNDEFLSDVTIKSVTGRTFYAHKQILMLTMNQQTDNIIIELNKKGYPDDLVELLLVYFYSNSLPINKYINEKQADMYLNFIKAHPELNNLELLLKTYLSNMTLKKQIENILNDIKESFERIATSFRCRDEQIIYGGIFSQPTKLFEIIRNAINELAISFVKAIYLLDIFSQKQDKLSRSERHEIIRMVKQCLPFFLNQLHRFLHYIHKQIYNLNETQRRDLAEYWVTKIDSVVNTVRKLSKNVRLILNKLSANDDEDKTKTRKQKLGKSFKTILHIKELKRLNAINEDMIKAFNKFEEKLKSYQELNEETKLNTIFKELTGLLENLKQEIPSFLRKMSNKSLYKYASRKINFRDFKYTFKLFASKTAWALDKLRKNNCDIDPLITELCTIVDEKNFTNAIYLLNLTKSPLNVDTNTNKPFDSSDNQPAGGIYPPPCILDSLCQPQTARKNKLAENALKLFESGKHTDIEFEVINDQIRSNNGNSVTEETKNYSVKVHGIIIASRCNWFKRALSSGMQEAINKKIRLYDINKELFDVFVKYLYSGNLHLNNVSIEQIFDLAALADQYECDSLKHILEMKAIKKISLSDNTFEVNRYDLLIIADRFNLEKLKIFCLENIIEICDCIPGTDPDNDDGEDDNDHRDETEKKSDFNNLPDNLKNEITKLVEERKKKIKKNIMAIHFPKFKGHEWALFQRANATHTTGSGSGGGGNRSRFTITPCYEDEYVDNTELASAFSHSSNTKKDMLLSYAHPLIVVDYARLELCYDQLKQMIQESQIQYDDDAQLVKSIITNDYDMDRCLLNILNVE